MLGSLHTSDILRYVPRLLVVDEDYSDENETLFKLDWNSVDAYKIKGYKKWLDQYWAEADIIGTPKTLPAQYDEWIRSLRYKIPHNYLTEIRHFTNLFLMESSRKRGFDTCIRDMCLNVRTAAINCAFNLLADCVQDPNTKKWYRRDDKFLIKHVLRYKFWRGYTGRGLVWFHSGFDDLAEWSKPENARSRSTATSCLIAGQCISAINLFEEEEEIHWEHTRVEENEPQERSKKGQVHKNREQLSKEGNIQTSDGVLPMGIRKFPPSSSHGGIPVR